MPRRKVWSRDSRHGSRTGADAIQGLLGAVGGRKKRARMGADGGVGGGYREDRQGRRRGCEEGRAATGSKNKKRRGPGRRWVEEQSILMATTDEPWTQLATAFPKTFHAASKLHCVTHEIAVMHFVVEAIKGEARAEARTEEKDAVASRAVHLTKSKHDERTRVRGCP